MKKSSITRISSMKLLILACAAIMVSLLSGCEDDDPQKEDTPELVTRATLTFTPDGGTPVVVTATDPDGEGVQDISVDGAIELQANETYVLSISLINELAAPSDPAYNITEEVREEAHEHMFFFEWTNNVFADPAGNGNVDNRADDVNYEDEDANALPLGLETRWTAGEASSGSFRVMLKHQPDLKTETSGASTGETDLDITFDININ